MTLTSKRNRLRIALRRDSPFQTASHTSIYAPRAYSNLPLKPLLQGNASLRATPAEFQKSTQSLRFGRIH